MRVAIVSHTYIVATNRGKLAELARIPNIDLLLVIPGEWRSRDVEQRLRAVPSVGVSYRTVVVPAWPSGFGSLLIYSPVPVLRALIRFRPDIVYVEEEPWSLAALEFCLLSLAVRSRLVFFTWDNIGIRLPLAQRLVRAVVSSRASAAVAGNEEARAVLGRLGFHRPISVIPQLGVDRELFTSPKREQDGFLIGYVGRLVPQKGVMLLLDAVVALPGTRVLIVGRGPMTPKLLTRARELGLDDRFELADGVAHDQVPAFLQRMSVLVLPSLTTPTWKEQFGHVLIEAMSCGVPVIGANSGAIPEVIGDAGIVVSEGSEEALVVALERLKNSPALRESYRVRGEARVQELYTNVVVAANLAAFLGSL